MGFLIKEETSEQERLLVGSMPHLPPQRQNDNASRSPLPQNQRGSKDIFLSTI